MSKEKNYLIVLNIFFLIVIVVLSYLYIQQKQQAGFTSTQGNNKEDKTFTREKYENLVRPTEQFPPNVDTLDTCMSYFETSYNQADASGNRKFPKGVWVDKSVIKVAFDDPTVDGFAIVPVRYPFNITSRSGKSVAIKDKVNFLIMLTKLKTGVEHEGQIDKIFNYNNPCPNPKSCPL